jgi:hypothetical protein
MLKKYEDFAYRSKISIWIAFVVLCICLSQMQPGLHMIFSLPLIGASVFLLRWVARWEGKHHHITMQPGYEPLVPDKSVGESHPDRRYMTQ